MGGENMNDSGKSGLEGQATMCHRKGQQTPV